MSVNEFIIRHSFSNEEFCLRNIPLDISNIELLKRVKIAFSGEFSVEDITVRLSGNFEILPFEGRKDLQKFVSSTSNNERIEAILIVPSMKKNEKEDIEPDNEEESEEEEGEEEEDDDDENRSFQPDISSILVGDNETERKNDSFSDLSDENLKKKEKILEQKISQNSLRIKEYVKINNLLISSSGFPSLFPTDQLPDQTDDSPPWSTESPYHCPLLVVLENRIKQHSKSLNKQQLDLANIKHRIRPLLEENEDISRQVEDTIRLQKTQTFSFSNQLSEEHGQLKLQNEALIREYENLEKEYQLKKEEIQKIEGEYHNHKNKQDEVANILTTIRSRIHRMLKRRQKMERNTDRLNSNIISLQKEIFKIEAKSHYEVSQSKLSQSINEESHSESEDSRFEVDHEIRIITNEIENLKIRYRDFQHRINTSEKKRMILTSSLNEITNRINEHQEKESMYVERLNEGMQCLEKQKLDFMNGKKSLRELVDEVESLRAEIKKSREEQKRRRENIREKRIRQRMKLSSSRRESRLERDTEKAVLKERIGRIDRETRQFRKEERAIFQILSEATTERVISSPIKKKNRMEDFDDNDDDDLSVFSVKKLPLYSQLIQRNENLQHEISEMEKEGDRLEKKLRGLQSRIEEDDAQEQASEAVEAQTHDNQTKSIDSRLRKIDSVKRNEMVLMKERFQRQTLEDRSKRKEERKILEVITDLTGRIRRLECEVMHEELLLEHKTKEKNRLKRIQRGKNQSDQVRTRKAHVELSLAMRELQGERKRVSEMIRKTQLVLEKLVEEKQILGSTITELDENVNSLEEEYRSIESHREGRVRSVLGLGEQVRQLGKEISQLEIEFERKKLEHEMRTKRKKWVLKNGKKSKSRLPSKRKTEIKKRSRVKEVRLLDEDDLSDDDDFELEDLEELEEEEEDVLMEDDGDVLMNSKHQEIIFDDLENDELKRIENGEYNPLEMDDDDDDLEEMIESL